MTGIERIRREEAERRIRGLLETLATAIESARRLHVLVAVTPEAERAGLEEDHMMCADQCGVILDALRGEHTRRLIAAARGVPLDSVEWPDTAERDRRAIKASATH
jgi:hypothetical protein